MLIKFIKQSLRLKLALLLHLKELNKKVLPFHFQSSAHVITVDFPLNKKYPVIPGTEDKVTRLWIKAKKDLSIWLKMVFLIPFNERKLRN